jgi:hypothetical protein
MVGAQRMTCACELMAQFEDPYGDRPLLDRGFHYDHYGAARYLPRGKRITGSV